MLGDMKARVLTLTPEIAELLKPCTPAERVGFIEGALLGAGHAGGYLSDKSVSVNRTDSGFSVTWRQTGGANEGATYTYDLGGTHLDTQRHSRSQSILPAKHDKGDIILRQLPNLERET